MDRAFGRCAGPKKVQHSAREGIVQQDVQIQQQWQHPRTAATSEATERADGGTTGEEGDKRYHDSYVRRRVCEVRKEGCTSSARPNNKVGPTPPRSPRGSFISGR